MKKLIPCLLLLIALYGCNQPQALRHNYKLTALVLYESGVSDTVKCTYTAEAPIEPQIIDNHAFDSHCTLYIHGTNGDRWDKRLATHVVSYKIITNNPF